MAGYTDFVELVRKEKSNRSENPIETAVEKAAANGILSDYLRRRSVEVINMIFGEWDNAPAAPLRLINASILTGDAIYLPR